jgi:predicted transcriptional regulator
MSTAVSIRRSDEIAYELEGLAMTIESYLQEYADYRVAIERLNDRDDEIISSNEMRNRLAI